MRHSGNWTAIERLPETPGVVKVTGNGYWQDGVFHPAYLARKAPLAQPRRGLLARVFGFGE